MWLLSRSSKMMAESCLSALACSCHEDPNEKSAAFFEKWDEVFAIKQKLAIQMKIKILQLVATFLAPKLIDGFFLHLSKPLNRKMSFCYIRFDTDSIQIVFPIGKNAIKVCNSKNVYIQIYNETEEKLQQPRYIYIH